MKDILKMFLNLEKVSDNLREINEDQRKKIKDLSMDCYRLKLVNENLQNEIEMLKKRLCNNKTKTMCELLKVDCSYGVSEFYGCSTTCDSCEHAKTQRI